MQIIAGLLLAGLAVAAPRPNPNPNPKPQDIDWDQVDTAADPVIVIPEYTVETQIASLLPTAVVATSVAAAIETDPASANKRRAKGRRDGTCAKQPAGAGPTTTPDTASDFLANPVYDVSRIHAVRFSRAFY
jgi:hypothetical protein